MERGSVAGLCLESTIQPRQPSRQDAAEPRQTRQIPEGHGDSSPPYSESPGVPRCPANCLSRGEAAAPLRLGAGLSIHEIKSLVSSRQPSQCTETIFFRECGHGVMQANLDGIFSHSQADGNFFYVKVVQKPQTHNESLIFSQ